MEKEGKHEDYNFFIITSSLGVAQDGHLQRVTISEAAHVQFTLTS